MLVTPFLDVLAPGRILERTLVTVLYVVMLLSAVWAVSKTRAAVIIATGAGANSRRALGTAVFGGMLVATLIGVILIPVLYVFVQRLAERRPTAEAG